MVMSNDITAAGSLIQIISQSRQNALEKLGKEIWMQYLTTMILRT